MNKVLLAIGDSGFSQILRNRLTEHGFVVLEKEVLHRDYLEEIVSDERPDILIVHDYYLASSNESDSDKEKELLAFFQKIRVEHDDEIRVVFLCEREKEDPFLSELVSRNVLDIFHNKSISTQELVEQLKDRPRFSRVSKFISERQTVQPSASTPTQPTSTEELFEMGNQEEEITEESPKVVKEKVVVQKVVNKQVVQKVVNKQVVKRDYKIQITNQTEKVVGIPVKKKLIMIGSPIQRSGSTFISHILARALAQMGVSVTYVESPFSKAYTFDRFIGHQVTESYRSKFYQFSKYIDPKLKSTYEWSKSDVDLICKHPTNEPVYKEEDVTFDNLIKVLFSLPSTVTIMDVGTDWQYELFQDVFDIADSVYFVLEPDLSNIQYLEESHDKSVQFFQKQLEHEKSWLVGNHFEKSILENELIHALYAEKMKTFFPTFSAADVFQSHLKGVFLNDNKEYQKRLEPCLEPLIEDILPRDLLKKHKKGSGFFKSIFNKKISIEKSDSTEEESIN